MNPDDLKKRTKQFALRVLKLVAALPNTVAGRAIGGQLVRSGLQSVRTIELRIVVDHGLSLLQSSVWLKKKQMRARIGWN